MNPSTDPARDPGQPVWDVPTRVFHWVLVALIAFSWWSAEYDRMEWHLWSGLGIMTLVLFRLLWGIFGSSTARFTSFVRGPRGVLDYLQGNWRGIGHTPLGALSVVALLLLVSLQVGLGLFSSDEDGLVSGYLAHWISLDASEEVADLHDDMFDVLLVFIGLHIAAVLFYLVFARKNLIGPMISGRGAIDAETRPMRPGKWWVAALCLAAALGITRWIVAGAPPF
ncbi:MAG TPA: cytochrome b/b6 domain-containing protein [Sphingomicrobium sp.]|nr:cytochrome b/b6 domain-containing protein [Sphingomicrobium sp.]